MMQERNNKWQAIPSNQKTSFDFLIKDVPNTTVKHRCLAVFQTSSDKPLQTASITEILSRTLAHTLPVLTTGKAIETERFTMLEYTTISENCPRTFSNRYLPTSEERQLNLIRLTSAQNVVHLYETRGNEINRIIFRLDANLSIKAMLILSYEQGLLRMALHSQKLRGYNGISKYSLNKPMLVFKSRSHTQTETLFEGTIGHGKITITP